MRRALAALALVVSLLVVFLPTSAHGDGGIAAMLQTRDEAIESADESAFMATVDNADPGFVERQRNWIRTAVMAGVVDHSSEVESGVDPARSLGLDGASLLETTLSYRIGEYDDRPRVLSVWYTFVERDGRWLVSSDSDGLAVGLESDVDALGLEPSTVVRSENFVVIAPVDRPGRASEVAALAEEARREVALGGDLQWSGRMPVFVVRGPKEAAEVLDVRSDTAQFVAFVAYRLLREGPVQTDAPRLYVQDANLSGQSRAAQLGAFVHELTHAAMSARTTTITPVWLQEGIAEWVRLGRPAVGAGTPGEEGLPPDSAFSGAELQAAYRESASAVAFMAGRHGESAPLALFDAIEKRGEGPGTPSYRIDEAFVETTGESMAAFVEAWRGPRRV